METSASFEARYAPSSYPTISSYGSGEGLGCSKGPGLLDSSYLDALSNDEDAATIVTKFSEQISKLTRDGMQEMRVFESETNSLRLTASDEVATILDEIKYLYSALFEASGKMMSELVQITINNDQNLAKRNQEELYRLGELAKSKSTELREQMRNDLKRI